MFEKLNRVRKMSTAEVVHRLRERCRREVDRFRWRCGISESDDELQNLIKSSDSSLKTYLHQGPGRRFYSSTRDRFKTSQFVMEHFPEWFEGAVQEGIRLREHRFDIL